MSEPFLSEIRIFSFDFAPQGWAQCNGQLMVINQNQALFALLGTTYGGDGRVNFALPNLRGRVPNHFGSAHNLGETGGEIAHTLSINEMPTHIHTLSSNLAAANANTNATLGTPAGNYWANTGKSHYSTSAPNAAMHPTAVSSVGGSQPHNNMQPYLVLNFCIALIGFFPSPN